MDEPGSFLTIWIAASQELIPALPQTWLSPSCEIFHVSQKTVEIKFSITFTPFEFS